jgi:hypothetical protein
MKNKSLIFICLLSICACKQTKNSDTESTQKPFALTGPKIKKLELNRQTLDKWSAKLILDNNQPYWTTVLNATAFQSITDQPVGGMSPNEYFIDFQNFKIPIDCNDYTEDYHRAYFVGPASKELASFTLKPGRTPPPRAFIEKDLDTSQLRLSNNLNMDQFILETNANNLMVTVSLKEGEKFDSIMVEKVEADAGHYKYYVLKLIKIAGSNGYNTRNCTIPDFDYSYFIVPLAWKNGSVFDIEKNCYIKEGSVKINP